MKSYKSNPVTRDELQKWENRNSYNPRTNRKIKNTGKIYQYLKKESILIKYPDESYNKFHGNLIDPLLKEKIPLKRGKPVFSFSYQWDPYTGERKSKDPRGPLFFDPDTLIYYFYCNRLNHLWIESNENFTGNYGDGMGKGELFEIIGRGHHPEWYLFRLPIPDAYCNKSANQHITFGPKLNIDEIKQIYNLSLEYKNNYFKRFGKKRPDLIKLYVYYHNAIKKPNYEDIEIFSKDFIDQQFDQLNRLYIDEIKKL